MGFKRTSEGRIFFHETDEKIEDVYDEPSLHDPIPHEVGHHDLSALISSMPARAERGAGAGLLQSQQTQVQIITLLKTLNERLKTTQADREKMAQEIAETRTLIESLTEKSAHYEQSTLDLESKLSSTIEQENLETRLLAKEVLGELQDTRKNILDLENKVKEAQDGIQSIREELALQTRDDNGEILQGQAALEKSQKEQNEKIEETAAEHARLARRVEKALEERARFLRRIERIEDMVTQTRDALSAKAMVLLTDQAITADQDLALREELVMLQAQTQAIAGNESAPIVLSSTAPHAPWWGKPSTFQIGSVVVLMLAGVLGGWVVGGLQKRGFAPSAPVAIVQAPPQQPAQPQPQMTVPAKETPPPRMKDLEWRALSVPEKSTPSEEPLSESPVRESALPPEIEPVKALDLSTPEDTDALLDKPAPVAGKALNVIEPAPPVPAESKPAVQASQDFPDPRTLTKPDSRLPEDAKEIEAQAFDGLAEAEHDLAALYTAGQGGVKQDYKRAAFWFEQAAKRGVGNAAYNLGVLYHQGLGMKPDMTKALELYTQAAALGHAEAEYNLGIAYIEGVGVAYDPQKATEYFTQAARKNVPEAAYNLGLIYENGLLGSPETDKALAWYKTAANQGNAEGKEALAQLAQTLGVKSTTVLPVVEDAPKPALSAPDIQEDNPQAQSITAQIQQHLIRMKLYTGASDGVMGPRTEDAIRSYQKLHNLPPDGKATDSLLKYMVDNMINHKGQ